jgi:hypothetical protein
MVTVSVAAGTNGAAAMKAKVSGVTICHTPGTGGLREGVGEWALSGRENCTEMVASLGTWDVPSTGVTEVTLSGPDPVEASTSTPGAEVGEAPARPAVPRPATMATPTPTAATVNRVAAMNQPLRPVDAGFGRDIFECAWEPGIPLLLVQSTR